MSSASCGLQQALINFFTARPFSVWKSYQKSTSTLLKQKCYGCPAKSFEPISLKITFMLAKQCRNWGLCTCWLTSYCSEQLSMNYRVLYSLDHMEKTTLLCSCIALLFFTSSYLFHHENIAKSVTGVLPLFATPESKKRKAWVWLSTW